MIEIAQHVALYDALYTPEVVMARVGHLGVDRQRQVERITRLLRARFDPGTMIEPRPHIVQILLAPPRMIPGKRPPDFEFWVVVSDRLFARQSLWRSARQEIGQALEEMTGMEEPPTWWLKIGAQSHDAFTPERLACAITLYRAEDDDPLRRRPDECGKEWAAALAAYEEEEAALQPVRKTFHATERVWFARREGLSGKDRQKLRRLIGYDSAIADEQRHADALYRAEARLLNTPAPDYSAVLRKFELLCADDPDAGRRRLVLADLRRLCGSGGRGQA